MNKRAPFFASLAAMALAFPLSSQAGLYLGGAGLWAERDSYDDVDGSGGGKAILGYRLEQVPLVFEASYFDAGDADINGTDYSLGFQGGTLTVGYFLQLSHQGSGVWIKGGAYSGDAKLKDSIGQLDKSSTSGPVFGIGGVWKLDRNFGLRLEYESMVEAEDFADNETVGMVSLGFVLEFMESRQRPRYERRTRYAAPPPPPAYDDRAVRGRYESGNAASPPPSEAAPAPVASERIAQRSELKSQPRASSPTLVMVPSGAEVQPGQRESNVEGDWVFVLYGRYSGWVREEAFLR